MTIRTHDGRGVWLACVIVLVAACGGGSSHGPHAMGTETDNPHPTKTPEYESPAQFGDQPAGQPPCTAPRQDGKPPRLPLWGQDGTLLVGADMYRGLVAIDASDAVHPQVQSTLPLDGETHQLIVESNAQVTLAIYEVPVGARDEVPTPSALQPVPRLVRYDAGNPTAIERIADVDIEGVFWSMRLHGSTLWVMSETVVDPVTSCNRRPYDCGYVEPIALIVAGYRLQGGAWQRIARAELKTTGPAWELPDGYAAFEARYDDNGDPQTGVLRFVRFDGDAALGDPGMVTVQGEVVPGAPIGLTDAVAHVFTLDYEHGNAELDTIAIEDSALLSRLDDLPRQQFDYSAFAGDGLFMEGDSSAPARWIDFGDPRAPASRPFPQGVTRVVPLDDGTRALGLSVTPGDLVASLFALQSGSPALLDQVTVNQGDPADDVVDVHVLGDRIAVGYRSRNTFTTVVLEAGDSALARIAQFDGSSDELLATGDMYFAPDAFGLHAAAGSGADVAVWSRDVIDEVGAGAYRATLMRDAGGGNVLELRRDGTLASSLDVGPMAERLIGDDEHVLVLSLEPRDQCEQSGLDCSHYAPNAAIVTLGDAPAIAATVELSDPDALGPTAQGENRIYWDVEGDVALALGHGRFVLVADYEASCRSEDECAALGVGTRPANQTMSAPGVTPPCAPGAICAPAPAPAPAPTVSGQKHATRLYLLDASASKPRLADPVDSVLELDDSRFGPPRISEGTLMITRIERPAAFGAPSGSQPAHFMLDRFVVKDGALHASPPVNVPGFPIALAAAGSILFSVEPDSKTHDAGTLYMLALDDDGAHSLDQAPLDASYSDAIAAFGKLFYLRHDAIDCDGKSTLVPFALPDDREGELRALHPFELPGGRYRIADARDQQLLLMDDRSHYVVLDVSGDTPELVKFLSAPAGPSRPLLQGDRIFGGSSLYADDLRF